MKGRIVGIGVVLTLVLAAVPARADPIPLLQITSGDIVTGAASASTGTVSISGSNFTWLGSMGGPNNEPCMPCVAGATQPFFWGAGESATFSPLIVNGVSYTSSFPAINFSMTSVGNFLIPPDAVTGTTVTFPFQTVNGFIAGYPTSQQLVPDWEFNFTGSGTASFQLNFDGINQTGQREFSSGPVTWAFQAPATTPEPGTLLLFSTGALALAARHYRRKR